MFLYDIAVPEMALNNLTYQCEVEIPTAVRVIVEVNKTLHVGFNLGLSKQNLSPEIKIKSVEGVIDSRPVIAPDLWDMALYAGRVCLCGAASALKVILPRPLIMGEKFAEPPGIFGFDSKNFREIDFFNPFDSDRIDFYLSELKPGERTLILFSQRKAAEKFFEILPGELRPRSLLWPSTGGKKYWLSWIKTHSGNFDLIVGTAGAIFSPLTPEKIIIEDEASQNFLIPPVLNISARSLAGRRAAFTGAKFITGGRIPSLKTFVRSKPEEKIFPDRDKIILADIFHSKTRNEELKGIKGEIPFTISLIKNTYRELTKKNSVIWILDRLGESSEVFCSRCGESVQCEKCKNSMRSENEGETLRCRICGTTRELPKKCEKCGFEVLQGRRPGLEALVKIAEKYYDKVILYADKFSRVKKNSLILSTRRGLELCEKVNPSLIAWLDFDLELNYPDHDAKLNAFNLIWESYWRGREKNSSRKVLIQSRRYGMKVAKFFPQGWSKFFPQELAERQEFELPPFSYLIELETRNSKLRENLLDLFFDSGIFVMDPGDESLPLSISSESLEPVQRVLSSLKFSPKELKITMQN